MIEYIEQISSFITWKISRLYQSKSLLVIANNALEANKIVNELHLFLPNNSVYYFPDCELLPYERMSIPIDLTLTRLKLLWQLSLNQIDILVVTPAVLHSLLCPISYLYNSLIIIKINDTLPPQIFKKRLLEANYTLVEKPLECGEFSIKGSIIELIPTESRLLLRIELFDDQIESIKSIDKLSCKVIDTFNQFELVPSREFPTDTDSVNKFKIKFNEYFPIATSVHSDLKSNILPSGCESYLPLFFDKCSSLFDYLDNSWSIIYFSNLENELNIQWSEINKRYQLNINNFPCMKPSDLFISVNTIFDKLKNFKLLDNIPPSNIQPLPIIYIESEKTDPYLLLRSFINNIKLPIIIVFGSLGKLQIVSQLLLKYKFEFQIIKNIESSLSKNKINLTCGNLTNGFIDKNFVIISENDLFKNDNSFIRKKSIIKILQEDSTIKEVSDIKIDDYVIHKNYGIGKYKGLNTQLINDIKYDMITLEYNNASILMIPVHDLYLINKYNSINNVEVVLNTLGSRKWNKIKTKINSKIEDTAAQLLELYAKREMKKGNKFIIPQEYELFAKSFLYQLTPDQHNAIQNVIDDMTNIKAMDRLVCGDVGFGKTEVALRAAFICAMNGKQVAFLCPTTLLTEQHYNNFAERFANFNIKIAEVSRFKTKKEILETLELTKLGKIDILIGTHRLIQKDIEFYDLGLVIIDEEHRFGVKQKEVLKALKHNVDFLALTATPIPRTLSMAIEGLKDFSIIATPPKRRLPINTIVCLDSDSIIMEAISRELKRGGQVFFLYNNITNIERIQKRVNNLFPQLKVEIAHAQMNEQKLEKTVKDFINQKFHILICSTIIENGIDIPNANTILIYSADHFGLSQLYQIRGRVGRSHHQAYCYLITSENISSNAQKKISALKSTSELGSGFNLATYDLEIRGAGDILGESQSGNINQIGLSLYSEMLKKTICKLKNIDSFVEEECEVLINETTIIPDNYCNDIKSRVYFYKMLSKAQNIDEINSIYSKLIDDYGLPPFELDNLIQLHYLRVNSQKIGIKSINISNSKIIMFLNRNNKVSTNGINTLIKQKSIKLTNDKLIKEVVLLSAKQKYEESEYILNILAS